MPRRTTTRRLSIRGAQLEEYARTISGRQSYRGNIDASIELNGLGNDVRNLHGGGEAHITQGDLGELPRLFGSPTSSPLTLNLPGLPSADRPRNPGKTAFDSADVAFTIAHGLTTFDPIKFTGNAFSLQGPRDHEPQGNLDLQLNVLWGRDQIHIPLLSEFTREASTPILIVNVAGNAVVSPVRHQAAAAVFNAGQGAGSQSGSSTGTVSRARPRNARYEIPLRSTSIDGRRRVLHIGSGTYSGSASNSVQLETFSIRSANRSSRVRSSIDSIATRVSLEIGPSRDRPR